jgi:hypothetical protein
MSFAGLRGRRQQPGCERPWMPPRPKHSSAARSAIAYSVLSAGVIAASCGLTALSPAQRLHAAPLQVVQATAPLQSTPGAETKPSAPSQPADTGARPRDVPPEPARPDAAAVEAGAKPALPPAPAEKIGEPVQAK